MKRSPAQPRANLNLGKQEPRRDERIGNIRGEIHLQAVQPERDAGNPAEQQMETVDRKAADEDADCDRGALARSAGALRAQTHERTPKLDRDAAHFKKQRARSRA